MMLKTMLAACCCGLTTLAGVSAAQDEVKQAEAVCDGSCADGGECEACAAAEKAATELVGDERIGDPYPFNVCVVSGMELGSMGDPIVKVYKGREVKYCCAGCIGKFEKDVDASLAKLDEKIVADQAPFYMLTTCPISGREVGEDAVVRVIGNRMVKFCCGGCAGKFAADPVKGLAALDKAVIEAQREAYPIENCVVSGEELGEDAREVVVAGRLIKLCCAGCEKRVKRNPAAVLAKVDEAWRKAKPEMFGETTTAAATAR